MPSTQNSSSPPQTKSKSAALASSPAHPKSSTPPPAHSPSPWTPATTPSHSPPFHIAAPSSSQSSPPTARSTSPILYLRCHPYLQTPTTPRGPWTTPTSTLARTARAPLLSSALPSTSTPPGISIASPSATAPSRFPAATSPPIPGAIYLPRAVLATASKSPTTAPFPPKQLHETLVSPAPTTTESKPRTTAP